MKVKRFECEIIEYKDKFVIVPKNKVLRFFGILPVANGKGEIINCQTDWGTKKDAVWAYKNLMKTKYVEI